MVDEGMMLFGRGRTPTEPEPLLSVEVEAMDGCLIRFIGPDKALVHDVEDAPSVTVCPLELPCELGGLGASSVGRKELLSARSSSVSFGDSGGEPKGAIALGTLDRRCGSEGCRLCPGGLVA